MCRLSGYLRAETDVSWARVPRETINASFARIASLMRAESADCEMKKIEEIQAELRQRQIPAWLFYDHHHRDPISYRILGLPESLMVSRRWFYLIPADGEPVKLLHRIEPHHLDSLPGKKVVYAAWHELVKELRALVSQMPAVAMQFSPENMIFLLSTTDAGTVDLIRSFGVKIVSSADLVARFEATWSEKQVESHFAAARSIDVIMDEVFPEIGRRVRKAARRSLRSSS